MIMKRSQSNSNETMTGWIAKSGKELIEKHGKTKAEDLMKRRYDEGLYYDSQEFPNDPEERFYYVHKPREMTNRKTVTDDATMEGAVNLDDDMAKSLLDETDGMFRAGGMVGDKSLGAGGQKALLDDLADGGVQAAPKKKAKRATAETSEEAKPKTQAEVAADLMAAILAESTAARKKSMNLGSVNYAGELASQLLTYAEKMEKYYKTLQQATSQQVTDETFYESCFKKIEKDRKWFVQAQVRDPTQNKFIYINICCMCIMYSSHYCCFCLSTVPFASKNILCIAACSEAAADSILSGLKRANRKKEEKDKEKEGEKGGEKRKGKSNKKK